MAKVKVEMPEEFLRKLSLLGSKTDEIAGRVLEAGGEVVLSVPKDNQVQIQVLFVKELYRKSSYVAS